MAGLSQGTVTPLDWIIAAVAAFMVLTGLRRGISGEFGTLAGSVAAIAAGLFLFSPTRAYFIQAGICSSAPSAAAALADFVAGLVVFGIVRAISAKFISVLVPQPTNAILGGISGLLKCALLAAALSLVGYFQTSSCAEGILADHSSIIRFIGSFADAHLAGALP